MPLLSASYDFTSSATDKWRYAHIYHWVVLWLLLRLILILILFDLVCAPPLQIKLQAHTRHRIKTLYEKVNTNFVSRSLSLSPILFSRFSFYFQLQTVPSLKNWYWTRWHIPDDKLSTLLEFWSSFFFKIKYAHRPFSLICLVCIGSVQFCLRWSHVHTFHFIFKVHEIFKWMPCVHSNIYLIQKWLSYWTICELTVIARKINNSHSVSWPQSLYPAHSHWWCLPLFHRRIYAIESKIIIKC